MTEEIYRYRLFNRALAKMLMWLGIPYITCVVVYLLFHGMGMLLSYPPRYLDVIRDFGLAWMLGFIAVFELFLIFHRCRLLGNRALVINNKAIYMERAGEVESSIPLERYLGWREIRQPFRLFPTSLERSASIRLEMISSFPDEGFAIGGMMSEGSCIRTYRKLICELDKHIPENGIREPLVLGLTLRSVVVWAFTGCVPLAISLIIFHKIGWLFPPPSGSSLTSDYGIAAGCMLVASFGGFWGSIDCFIRWRHGKM